MSPIEINQAVIDKLVTEVTAHGDRTEETGAFLLAREGQPDLVDTIAIPGYTGVDRKRDLFAIDASSMLELFETASEDKLVIRAQVHSHRRGAFLSRTDLAHGFSVDGFITCVVPWYADPSPTPTDWGWWQFTQEQWHEIEAPATSNGICRVVRFAQGSGHGH